MQGGAEQMVRASDKNFKTYQLKNLINKTI